MIPNKDEEEVSDFENIPMDNVPLMKEDISFEDDDLTTVQPEADKKTDKDIQIDQLEQLLSYRGINSWERGFCGSCLNWLKSKPEAQLSYKQKDVLAKTVDKHFS